MWRALMRRGRRARYASKALGLPRSVPVSEREASAGRAGDDYDQSRCFPARCSVIQL